MTEDFSASHDQKSHLLRQMDVTMVQKLAFAGAHFQLHDGARILDLGCGSGHSSYNFALLNPRLQVVAVDYDADYIRQAKVKYGNLPNLSFIQADARALDVGKERFNAIFNCSVQHEFYSFSNYSLDAVRETHEAQLRILERDGIILLRDFERTARPEEMVWMDLPVDGPRGLESSAALLRRYARIANALLPEPQRGFLLEEVGAPQDGWQRFYLAADWAHEFVWRKEYRDRFDVEAREKYGVWTARQYRDIPESMGARVLYTSPYRNPWIDRNWIEGKVRLYHENMQPMTPPPSNYIAVIQNIAPGAGQRFREHRIADTKPSYLRMESFRDRATGRIHDLASRPGEVYDVLPYQHKPDGRVVVYARSAYPRPLVNVHPRQMASSLDGKSWSGHMVEPLAVANQTGTLEQAVRHVLAERAGMVAESADAMERGLAYYTAPANINERVTSVFVPVRSADYEQTLSSSFSGFSNDGTVRAYDLQDLLRGVQVGMLAEARLELNAYALARRLGVKPEGWIGDRFEICQDNVASLPAKPADVEPCFEKADHAAGYLRTVRSVFVEEARPRLHRGDVEGSAKTVLASRELEFVVPDARKNGLLVTADNVSVVPVIRDTASGELMIGLRRMAVAAITALEDGGAPLAVTHVKLHSGIRNTEHLRDYVADYFHLGRGSVRPLGEGYFPSMGVMPGRTFPMLVTGPAAVFADEYEFVKLRDAFDTIETFRSADTIVAVFRCAHALDAWPEAKPTLSSAPKP